MQNPFSILGQILAFPGRWGIGYMEERLIFKNRALTININAKNLPRFRMGAPSFRAFRHLAKLDDLRLVVMCIEQTPSGWAQLLALRTAIEEIRASGKTVWVHLLQPFRDALYLASAADQIFILPHSSLFWNGLGNRLFFYAGMLDKLGVVADVESAGSYKSFGESYAQRFPSPENRDQLHSIYHDLESHMIECMSDALKLRPEDLRQAFQESPLSPERAMELGLIHGQYYSEQLLDKAKSFVGIDNDIPRFSSWLSLHQSQMRLRGWGDSRRRLAVVSLSGTVIDHGEGVVISPEQVLPVLKQLREDDRVAAVILKINSPGGSAIASERIAHAVEKLCFKKPVVALLENVAASGGYYIAARCHEIIAHPTTITGSIGVVGGKLAIAGALSKIGVTSEVIAPTPEGIGFFDLTQPFSPSQRQRFRQFLKQTYDRFLNVVAMGRKLPLEAVAAVAEGRVWTGRQALEHRLVDALGTEATALQHAARLSGLRAAELRVIRRSFEPSFQQKLRSQIGLWLQGDTKAVPNILQSIVQKSPFWQLLYRHPMEALMIFDAQDDQQS